MLVMRWSQRMRRTDARDRRHGDRRRRRPARHAGAGCPSRGRAGAAHGHGRDRAPGSPCSTSSPSWCPRSSPSTGSRRSSSCKIVTESWPAHLAERGLLSPADRRNRAILAEARAPGGIAAGRPGDRRRRDGLDPRDGRADARGRAACRNGAIVLPGLDTHLDAESWAHDRAGRCRASPHPEHPQFGLKELLDRLGLKREDVRALGDASTRATRCPRRADRRGDAPVGHDGALVHLRQVAPTATQLRASLDGVSLIEAPSAQDEAEAVALILREAAETPGRTAALISPDRCSRAASRCGSKRGASASTIPPAARSPRRCPARSSISSISAIAKGFAPADDHGAAEAPVDAARPRARSRCAAPRARSRSPCSAHLYLGSGLEGLATGARRRLNRDVAADDAARRGVQRLLARGLEGRARSAGAPGKRPTRRLRQSSPIAASSPLHAIAAAHVADRRGAGARCLKAQAR